MRVSVGTEPLIQHDQTESLKSVSEVLSKLIDALTSSRNGGRLAAGAAVSLALLYWFNDEVRALADKAGLPEEFAPFLVVALGFGLGVLLADGVIWSWRSVGKARARKQADRDSQERLRGKAKLLPSLPVEQLEVLADLGEGFAHLNRFDRPCVSILEDEGWIERLHRIDKWTSVYRIRLGLEQPVCTFLRERRESHLRSIVSGVTDDEREFLRIFADDQADHGTEKAVMPRKVYQAGRSLARQGILVFEGDPSRHFDDHVRIEVDAVQLIQELAINGPLNRTEVTIDRRQVEGGGA